MNNYFDAYPDAMDVDECIKARNWTYYNPNWDARFLCLNFYRMEWKGEEEKRALLMKQLGGINSIIFLNRVRRFMAGSHF